MTSESKTGVHPTRLSLHRSILVYLLLTLFQPLSSFLLYTIQYILYTLLHSPLGSSITLSCILKRVIVTPAVYPGLNDLHHINVQSTGQNSHSVKTLSGYRYAMFRFNSRVPLVRSSSETTVECGTRLFGGISK